MAEGHNWHLIACIIRLNEPLMLWLDPETGTELAPRACWGGGIGHPEQSLCKSVSGHASEIENGNRNQQGGISNVLQFRRVESCRFCQLSKLGL